MKKCKRCNIKFEYIEFVNHRCYTVKEWKRFEQFTDDIVDGQSMTMQEVILDRHTVFLIDHTSRHDHKFVKVPLKERMKGGFKSLPGKITQKNFDKGIAAFDKGMKNFSNEMDALTKGLGGNDKDKPKIWGTVQKRKTNPSISIWGTVQKKTPRKKKGGKPKLTKEQENFIRIWNEPVQKKKRKKSSPKKETDMEKIWGNPQRKKSKPRKDQHLEKIWGKKK